MPWARCDTRLVFKRTIKFDLIHYKKIVIGNGISDSSLNPGQSCLFFFPANALGKSMKPPVLPYLWVYNRTDWVL